MNSDRVLSMEQAAAKRVQACEARLSARLAAGLLLLLSLHQDTLVLDQSCNTPQRPLVLLGVGEVSDTLD